MSTTLTISPPNDKQKLFLKASVKHIGFGGARGGGKSWSVRTKAKLLALNYAGIRILIVLKPNVEGATKLGEAFGARLKDKKITKVVFDRNGYLYHGVVKALADGTRSAGIVF